MSGPLVIVGDTLLDRDVDGTVERVCPDAPAPVLDERSATDRPGGAGLAALLAAADGHDVVLVTALADDPGGARLAQLLAAAGVRVYPLPLPGATPEKIRLRAGGQVLLRLDRGGSAEPPGPPPEAVVEVLAGAAAILVSDYGRGVARQPELRRALGATAAPVVWDPHPRGPIAVPGARLVTPNEAELHRITGDRADGPRLPAVTRGARLVRDRWRADAVAVTLGGDGALLCHSGTTPLVVPAEPVDGGDTCGAGDRFATAAAAALAEGALVSEAVETAVRTAASYVASGGVAGLRPDPRAAAHAGGAGDPGTGGSRPDGAKTGTPAAGGSGNGAPGNGGSGHGGPGHGGPGPGGSGHGGPTVGREAVAAVLARVRAAGGTVVATGGCFDLLHAGHVATLEAARQLGDCLIVCLNSDESVAGLKGDGRPVVSQADRARLLAALGCVDAVLIFDESTPHAVLSWLRPDVWVKGGDYAETGGGDPGGPELPEAEQLRRWGGQSVLVPYLDGRSTTGTIAAARANGRQLTKGRR
ncbi:PfkB family carbohydrate kinase [Micromonospora sp. NPDC049559]|uniref:PfkB family carbohydrate kinase n=1 Tax=Micromonospora sp. NPDC049559 TaxID=3155923 RepID=UPI0034388091